MNNYTSRKNTISLEICINKGKRITRNVDCHWVVIIDFHENKGLIIVEQFRNGILVVLRK